MNNAITVTAIVAVPVAQAWRLWTLPQHITQWCAASDDWEAPRAENDVREGGRFTTLMAAKDKSAEFEFGGVYTKVITCELFEYRMDDGREARVRFEHIHGGTKITEEFEPESINPLDMQQAGWQAILDNFKKYAENASSK